MTLIHLWNKQGDYLLSSQHVLLGSGEGDIGNNYTKSSNDLSPSKKTKRKTNSKTKPITITIANRNYSCNKYVAGLCNDNKRNYD